MTVEERVKARSEFKLTIANKTKEELDALMLEIIEESKVLDKEVSELTYDLDTAKQKDAFEAIQYFINKQKVRWDYTLGLIELYEYFDKAQTEMTFAMLDTVLRMLGQLEFDGYVEWKKVAAVNTYFTPIAAEYRKTTEKIYDIAERFQAIDGQLKLYETPAPEDQEA
jgi:hypothetical protein